MNPDGSINWGMVLTTLTIRFIGVFIILGILQIGVYVAGAIVSKLTPGKTGKPA